MVVQFMGVLIAALAVVVFAIDLAMKRKMHREQMEMQRREAEQDRAQRAEIQEWTRRQADKDRAERDDVQEWLKGQAGIVTNAAATISGKVAEKLSANAGEWATTALEAAKLMPHSQTLFGARLQHFSEEKRYLCEHFLPLLVKRCRYHVGNGRRVVLLMDSGTTIFHLFGILGDEAVSWHQNHDELVDSLSVVTNNLPGIEALIETGRVNPRNRHSDLAIKCELLPGTPLPVYSALLGPKTQDAVLGLKAESDTNTVFIALITGNWIRIRRSDPRCPLPLVRGDGHMQFKQALVDCSDEIYVLSPLGKLFRDASSKQVNDALKLTETSDNPDRHPYEDMDIGDDVARKVKLVTTSRHQGRLLGSHSSQVKGRLEAVDYHTFEDCLGGDCDDIPHLMIPWDQLPDSRYEQMVVEFPHPPTRDPAFMEANFDATIGRAEAVA